MANGEEGAEGPPPGAAPPVQPTAGSGLVTALKILTIIMGVLAVVFIFLMTRGRAESDDTVMGLNNQNLLMISLVMGAVGMVFGAIGVFAGWPRAPSSRPSTS